MEKRKMLTFELGSRLMIVMLASVVLLGIALYLSFGIFNGDQSKTGVYGLAFFTLLFAVGGGFGLIRTVLRYRKAKKSRELR